MSRIFLLICAFALVVAACSGEAAVTTTATGATTADTVDESTTAAPTTTTTADPTSATPPPAATATTIDQSTTVTTGPADFRSPLNGLPSENEIKLDRRAIAIKIDNHPQARPQSGVMDADTVIEMRVEGGLTRFIAVFHDNESDFVGPNRSLRPTDSTVLARIGAPLAVSGGQAWIQQLTNSRNVGFMKTDSNRGEADLNRTLEERDGEMEVTGDWCRTCGFRLSTRSAPHNLYTKTDLVRRGADAMELNNDPPLSLYPIVQWSIPETTADQIVLVFSDRVTVTWDWDGDRYLRTHNGVVHEVQDREGDAQQMAVEVLVILAGEFYTEYPPSGTDGSGVPTTDTLGSGPAWVFARGAVWEGTWERAEYTDEFTLKNADGTITGVPAGFSWVSIFPESQPVTWE